MSFWQHSGARFALARTSEKVLDVTALRFANGSYFHRRRETPVEVLMANVLESREESRRETGASLMFIGLAIWVAGALVAFFFPAAVRIGRQGMFLSVMAILVVIGLALMTSGYVLRGKPEE
jgi:hypothetical protein